MLKGSLMCGDILITMNAHTRPWDVKRLQNYLGWNKAMKLVIFLENGGEVKKVVLT